MGCLKLSYRQAGESMGKTAVFLGESLKKKECALKNRYNYYPFGLTFNSYQRSYSKANNYKYNGKEEQEETGWIDYGARMYQPDLGRWNGVDNLSEKYSAYSPYNYVLNNPIGNIDPDGNEPIKPLAGTVQGFVSFMNNLSTGLGKTRGSDANAGMLRMGKTKMTFKGPKPANTAPFNTSGGNRYIYTKKGGWVDMAHFMFYAGRSYGYKQNGEEHPVGKALQDGLLQELGDMINAEHSAFSYEDLPSDKFGAQFGADFFDPESDLSFAEQLQNFLVDVLGATDPENAPNYDNLPDADDTSTPPTETNMSSDPKHTTEEEKKEDTKE
ncbi:RHS repeat domain-containing protein [Marivirga arenosa]|uniref:RHS repeat-associated core domain-containing protein n=1 Tax=Marivirga arenosa TaxID=3059076 RepID=A0AA49GH60_9BACT|nr:RHS repeat-associated core domain-containing protein [Marivirga sp. BKB1-2]WKK80404.2 RHS repeat-associated core domain-containing protein [Marivirga sp. BKB1-2]WKK83296.2 RHS repeat-associated core domain-containing protein [Marivirga sp. BKB1-2]WNB17013.1 RHS repeat-associated core domain-containing protein [Marivirga sp. BKB1-2]